MELGIRQQFNEYTNYFTGGIFKGVHYLGATSGMGKTTWAFPFYILPILLTKDMDNEMNEKLLIIANEQDKKTFQKLFLVGLDGTVQSQFRSVVQRQRWWSKFFRKSKDS